MTNYYSPLAKSSSNLTSLLTTSHILLRFYHPLVQFNPFEINIDFHSTTPTNSHLTHFLLNTISTYTLMYSISIISIYSTVIFNHVTVDRKWIDQLIHDQKELLNIVRDKENFIISMWKHKRIVMKVTLVKKDT